MQIQGHSSDPQICSSYNHHRDVQCPLTSSATEYGHARELNRRQFICDAGGLTRARVWLKECTYHACGSLFKSMDDAHAKH